MRFVSEFEHTPTEALVTLAGAILSLEYKSVVDTEQLADMGLVTLRRVEKAMKKAQRAPAFEEMAALPMGTEWIEGYTDALYNVTEAIRQVEASA